jgi:hypothetical protein
MIVTLTKLIIVLDYSVQMIKLYCCSGESGRGILLRGEAVE